MIDTHTKQTVSVINAFMLFLLLGVSGFMTKGVLDLKISQMPRQEIEARLVDIRKEIVNLHTKLIELEIELAKMRANNKP